MKTNSLHLNYFLFFIFFIPLMILNHLVPQILDDCYYALNHGKELNGIFDILKSQFIDYHTHSGRVISHSFAQIFAGILNKTFFNILNALAFVLLIKLIANHVSQNKKLSALDSLFIFILSFSLSWFLLPDQFISLFLISGSLNYLWGGVLVFFYIIYFQTRIVRMNNNSWLVILLVFLFSFLVGAWMEMYSVALFPALIIWTKITKIKATKPIISSLLGLSLGTAFLVLAPGNFERMGSHSSVSIISYITTFLSNCFKENIFWLLIILSVATIIHGKFSIEILKKILKNNILIISMILFSFIFIFISKAGWSRTFFAISILIIILIIKALVSLNMKKTYKVFIICLALLSISCDYTKELKTFLKNNQAHQSIIEQMAESKDEVLYLPSKLSKSRKAYPDFLSISKDDWRNISFAVFHDKEAITCLPKTLFDSLYTQPYLVNNNNMIFINCYTSEHIDYYVYPLTSNQDINEITLMYSESPNIAVLKMQVLKLVKLLRSDKYIDANIENVKLREILTKNISATVNLQPSDYTILITNHGKYLIFSKSNKISRYFDGTERLISVLI